MTQETISLNGLNKADVLVVLYNASKPQGMGFMQYDPRSMTREEAQSLLDEGQTYFDYLKGRVMKVDLSGDELDPRGYDRDNGQGAAERVISSLRSTGKTSSDEIQTIHKSNTQDSARDVKGRLHERSRYEQKGHMGVLRLGYDDVADALNERLDQALKKLDDLEG